MPSSLKKLSEAHGAKTETREVGAEALTQAVRLTPGGEVKYIPVGESILRLSQLETDDLTDGLRDPNIVHDPNRTRVGDHLASNVDGFNEGLPEAVDGGEESLDSYRRSGSKKIGSIINQAIDEVVQTNSDLFFQGWERDPEFVEGMLKLVLAEYEFEESQVRQVLSFKCPQVNL